MLTLETLPEGDVICRDPARKTVVGVIFWLSEPGVWLAEPLAAPAQWPVTASFRSREAAEHWITAATLEGRQAVKDAILPPSRTVN